MRFANSQRDCQMHIYILQMLTQQAADIKPELGEQYERQLELVFRTYQGKGGNIGF